MKRLLYILPVAMVALLSLAACSTQKNTAATRAFHSMKTKYNIYFNGNNSFEEGLIATNDANKDNYAAVLPLYPQSNHEAAKAATSQMDKTIEKCRKCIKLHSIKKKPTIDPKKRQDPKYRAWLEHEEFNESMDEAWLLLGMAEFNKGEFESSIGTFNYIIKHFSYDKDLVAQCQLWVVRAYAELGWLYEAEDLLQKINIEDLKYKNASLYAAAAGDLKMKTEQYADAIPFVKLRLPDEKRKLYRPRFQYALGQLYEITGETDKASAAFKKVSDMNPNWEMDFNARLKYNQLSSNHRAALKTLNKMAKDYKYKDKLDQIYGAIGNIYLADGDTVKALEFFAKGIEEGTQNGQEKAALMVQAADMLYDRQEYAQALPYYKEAANIISATEKSHKRISKRAETLDLLVAEQKVVLLQDSLQQLSKLSEEEQLAVVNKIISDLEEQEKADKEKAEQAERAAKNGEGGLRSVNTQNMLGGSVGSADWYFYNAQLLRSGQQQFQQKWGNRQLEDNWRRINKMAMPNLSEPTDTQLGSTDSTALNDTLLSQPKLSTDTHDPQFYLQQIPKTTADLQMSDSLIATALYNMVYIYQDQVEDAKMAQLTFEEFEQRFPNDSRLLNLYYSQYLNCIKHSDDACADRYRLLIASRYPDSEQARIVSNPAYFDNIRQMALQQDSLYEALYNAYTRNEYDSVKRQKEHIEKTYPSTPLMPKVLFLNAIAVAKTEGQTAFVSELKDMVNRYPESDVGAMAKDMLALMNEGMESQQGGGANTLSEKRLIAEDVVDSTLITKSFSTERQQSTLVVFMLDADEQKVNDLLYEVALFNFSQFMIKDFDLKIENPLTLKLNIDMFNQTEQKTKAAVEVLGLESYDEGLWYQKLITSNADMSLKLKEKGVTTLVITEENFELIKKKYTLDEYNTFVETELK